MRRRQVTRKEAIKYLTEEQKKTEEVVALNERDFGVSESVWHTEYEAFALAITALREQEERSKGCEFCRKFDFKTVAPEIDKYGARLLLATSDCVFPNNRQFKLCPVCGRRLEEV